MVMVTQLMSSKIFRLQVYVCVCVCLSELCVWMPVKRHVSVKEQ